ncbi:wax ester/triacylglycerol synthase family O-acyltransferase [Mycolicibacterium sp. 120270]|uniref:WS/DGAT/MGAT family O-acyltransferase n=1 Tax=Mycolicibacterium sp. 120270 TaxID=3090600 RepID=UPI00299D6A57|nr:wax ester/triacylglycerol synthase family O-acyltransferase [Mycolicibacterium sp. 120270]MDX1882206.1 wax ester/triacylglycerol synthase family O-acyltransferase [Mycolicibacterium sp. 120270]
MRQLTSLDTQFLAMENQRVQGHVSVLGIYDAHTDCGRPLDAALVGELISRRLHLLPTFRWRLAPVPLSLDYPYWVDDGTFDIEYHVRELALPAPGSDRQLAEQVARIIGRQLDRARPLWEVYVIGGLDNGRRVAVLTKMHHAAVDGVSGAEVMSILLDDTTDREPDPAPPVVAEPFPSDVEMLGRGLIGLMRQPLRMMRAGPTALPHLDDVPTIRHLPGVRLVARTGRALKRVLPATSDSLTATGSGTTAPRTRFQARVSPHRRVAFGSMSLREVKSIKNTFGCTVNDVVVAICTSGLRSWLDERGELPAEPLAGFVPMSVRTAEQKGTFGNRVSVMLTELPTDEADPMQRLARISDAMRAAKERQRALPASLLQDANHFIPPALLAQAARATSRLAGMRGLNQPANVMISNVPGPSTPLYLGGARQHAQVPVSGVLDGIGINITVMSYQDSLEFGVVVDRELVDDPWTILDALRAGLSELAEHASRHTPPPEVTALHTAASPRRKARS